MTFDLRSPRIAVATATVLVLSACPGGGNPAASGPTGESEPKLMKPPVEIRLLTSTTRLTMAERSGFRIGLEATNTSRDVVDPGLSNAVLLVDEVRSPAWDLALGNGIRAPAWEALPPGETVSLEWPLGEALFPKPGAYVLRLVVGDVAPTATVEVAP